MVEVLRLTFPPMEDRGSCSLCGLLSMSKREKNGLHDESQVVEFLLAWLIVVGEKGRGR